MASTHVGGNREGQHGLPRHTRIDSIACFLWAQSATRLLVHNRLASARRRANLCLLWLYSCIQSQSMSHRRFCFATSQAFSLDEQRASCRYAVRVSPFSRPRTCPKLGAPPHRPRKTPKQCVSPVQMNREARLCTPRNGICYSRVPIFNEVDND